MTKDILSASHTNENYFLSLVAHDLQQKFGNDMSRIVVVFPNKRASLFFNQYLLQQEDQKISPIWSPKYQSIKELFTSFSQQTIADPIEIVCKIYQLYLTYTKNNESLDFFYGWGEKILNDFNNIDKNLVDAKRLFRNLSDIKELENQDFLDERQEQVLREFFKDFSMENNTYIRERFLKLWNELLNIYQALNQELADEGFAYEGALYRNVIESLQKGIISLPSQIEKYVFVGFNVLNGVEEQLFKILQSEHKALFYWDYDVFYVKNHLHFEAGYFLRKNLEKFPNELPECHFHNMSGDENKTIELVAANSETAQAVSAVSWIEQNLTKEDEKKTAIVICNENLLHQLLHSIPPCVKDINITKGYPLTHTQSFAYLLSLLTQKEKKTEENMCTALQEIAESLRKKAETFCEDPSQTSPTFDNILQSESLFQCYSIINRLTQVVEKKTWDISMKTLKQLVRQIANQTTVPFSGEPAMGLQIMGMLETRCLDFDHLLLLSFNEGTIPENNKDYSFIPYQLRVEYGLTTEKHKTALSAYYFYRLLQRGKRIRIMYNTSSDGMHKGEMSRFLTQLLIESPWSGKMKTYTLSTPGQLIPFQEITIDKNEKITEQLQEISPSAINAYLRCPIQFYFKRIANIKEPQSPPDVIEPNTLGTLFHSAAEYIYRPDSPDQPKIITQELLSPYCTPEGKKLIDQYIHKSFENNKIPYNIIIAEVIATYLRLLIKHDLQNTPFEVVDVEKNTSKTLYIDDQQGNKVEMKLKGTIDRLDTIIHNGQRIMRVVDYKTGGHTEKAKSLDALFQPDKNHPHYILQACLYALTLVEHQKIPIVPALFYVHQAADDSFSPYLSIDKSNIDCFQDIAHDFQQKLEDLLSEIIHVKQPFTPTTEKSFCKSCAYATLCQLS